MDVSDDINPQSNYKTKFKYATFYTFELNDTILLQNRFVLDTFLAGDILLLVVQALSSNLTSGKHVSHQTLAEYMALLSNPCPATLSRQTRLLPNPLRVCGYPAQLPRCWQQCLQAILPVTI